MPTFRISWSRFRNRETSRSSRKLYDKRLWFLFLAFFLVLALMAPLLSFVFGRTMGINTFICNQDKVYRETLIAGDLSQEGMQQARLTLLNPFTAKTLFTSPNRVDP